MKSALLALFVVARLVDAQTVFQSDFDASLPEQIQPGAAQLTAVQGFAGLGPAGRTFNGNFLRSPTANKVTLQLTGLPSHRAVNLSFLLAAIDSLDGAGSFPSGDYFHIRLDGVTIFRESLANALPSQIQSYLPAPGALLARWQNLGFTGPGSFYTDSAYDFGAEPAMSGIPHSSSSLTLEFEIEGQGAQSLGDESWAMDQLSVTLTEGEISGRLRLSNYKVSYPAGPTPYFTGVVNGAAPRASVTLQASTDLGKNDLWQNLSSGTANENGAVSFVDVPDPSAAGAVRNFYRAVVTGP